MQLPPTLHEADGGGGDARFQTLCRGNTYSTTLHACNSAIVKLSKLTVATKVYRGVSGALLPAEFWCAAAARTPNNLIVLQLACRRHGQSSMGEQQLFG